MSNNSHMTKPCGPVQCPPFEEATLEVLPGQPAPGAFARAVAQVYHGTPWAGVFTLDYEDEWELGPPPNGWPA